MRTAEFDRTYVLRQAMQTFMQFGYSKTSMQKLTESTGLHPGSIYCAFKNKQGLLLAAIEQYQVDKREELHKHFAHYPTFKEGLAAFLDSIVNEDKQDECSRVCLLTKTLSEIDGQDPEICRVLSNNLHQFEQTLTELFVKAKNQNQLPANLDPKLSAQFLVLGIYGLRTYVMTNKCQEQLSRLTSRLLLAVLSA